jgi:hypothetical protein
MDSLLGYVLEVLIHASDICPSAGNFRDGYWHLKISLRILLIQHKKCNRNVQLRIIYNIVANACILL